MQSMKGLGGLSVYGFWFIGFRFQGVGGNTWER